MRPTRDRLLSWGLNTESRCVLCSASPESRDHLFFHCPFSSAVWSSVSIRCSIVPIVDWEVSLASLIALDQRPHIRSVILLAWQCTIYYLWAERNGRIHRNIFRSPEQTLRLIDSTIQNRISSFRGVRPATAASMYSFWRANDH